MPLALSIDVLEFPVKPVPLSFRVQTFYDASHSLTIAFTSGSTLVNVYSHSNASWHEASSESLRKTTTLPV